MTPIETAYDQKVAECEVLRQQLAEAQKDAARYRWLLNNDGIAFEKFEWFDCDLEDAIDAAITRQGGE